MLKDFSIRTQVLGYNMKLLKLHLVSVYKKRLIWQASEISSDFEKKRGKNIFVFSENLWKEFTVHYRVVILSWEYSLDHNGLHVNTVSVSGKVPILKEVNLGKMQLCHKRTKVVAWAGFQVERNDFFC